MSSHPAECPQGLRYRADLDRLIGVVETQAHTVNTVASRLDVLAERMENWMDTSEERREDVAEQLKELRSNVVELRGTVSSLSHDWARVQGAVSTTRWIWGATLAVLTLLVAVSQIR